MIKQPETSSVFANNYMVCASDKDDAKAIRLQEDSSANNEKIQIENIGDASKDLKKGVLMFEVVR